MQQYFIERDFKVLETFLLPDKIAYHLKTVLKLTKSTQIRISNTKQLFIAEVKNNNSQLTAKIIEEITAPFEFESEVVLFLALIKKDRFEWALQKATELGVSKIIPVITDHCVVKINGKIEKKLERWQTIVVEAAEQAHRLKYPTILAPVELPKINDYLENQNFVAYEDLKQVLLQPSRIKKDSSLSILIGPEGGFSKRDLRYLKQYNFQFCGLGPRILRSETAVVSALSVINLALNNEVV